MDLRTLYDSITHQVVEQYVKEHMEENLNLEFKVVADSSFARRDDRKNYAKAMSGFANSSGGIVIWGVEAHKNEDGVDCAVGIDYLDEAPLLMSKLNEHAGQFVKPIVDGVVHKLLATSDRRGLVVTLVPESDSGPHMAKAGEDRYYKRSGDSFYRMEHFDIEDMFGRRKKPAIALHRRLLERRRVGSPENPKHAYAVVVGLFNSGRSTAKYPYVRMRVNKPYAVDQYGLDGNGTTGLPRLTRSLGSSDDLFGASANIVIHPDSLLEITRITGEVFEKGSGPKDLIIEADIAVEDMRPRRETLTVSWSELQRT